MSTFEPERNIFKTVGLVVAGAVIGVLVSQCEFKHTDNVAPVPTAPTQLNGEMTPDIATPPERTRVLPGTSAAVDPGYTCTLSETPNGVRETCGPRHVDPTADDCAMKGEGMIRVCIRKYGVRTCDCYPDGEDHAEDSQ